MIFKKVTGSGSPSILLQINHFLAIALTLSPSENKDESAYLLWVLDFESFENSLDV